MYQGGRTARQGQTEVKRYRILQMAPAAPGTFALFAEVDRSSGKPTGRLYRDPVPVWGTWEAEVDIHGPGDNECIVSARKETGAGPLILAFGQLQPAEDSYDYEGVRIGICIVVGDGDIRFDKESSAYEPTRDQDTPSAADGSERVTPTTK